MVKVPKGGAPRHPYNSLRLNKNKNIFNPQIRTQPEKKTLIKLPLPSRALLNTFAKTLAKYPLFNWSMKE